MNNVVRSKFVGSAVLSATVCLVSAATAQRTAWAVPDVTGRRLEHAFAAGDHNGDGYQDVWAYVVLYNEGNIEFVLLSGRTGETLRQHHFRTVEDLRGMSPNGGHHRLSSAGDFDGDGVNDWSWCLCAGSRYPAVEVRSGRDGSQLLEIRAPNDPRGWSYSMLGDVDVDGDGWPELLISHIDRNGFRTGSVLVYQRDGSLRYSLDSPQDWQYGTALAKAGDVDGDGGDDYIVCAPEASLRGAAILVSGRLGRILQIGYGELPFDRMDGIAAGCGDMDGDGVPDFAAGSIWGARGVVRAFSGRTGQPLHSWVGPYDSSGGIIGASFGHTLTGGVDVDRDGVPDLLTGSRSELRGGIYYDTLYALSGRDGRILMEYYGQDLRMAAQPTLVPVPVPGGGYPRVALKLQRFVQQTIYKVEAIDLTPIGTMPYGYGCGTANTPRPPRLGVSRDVDRSTRLMASDVAAGSSCILLLGGSSSSFGTWPLPMKLDRFGWRDCELWTSVDATFTTTARASGFHPGLATVELPWPLATTSLVPIHAQWLCLEPQGARFTEAARLLLRFR